MKHVFEVSFLIAAATYVGCSTESPVAAPLTGLSDTVSIASATTTPTVGPVSLMTWPNAECVLYPTNQPDDTLDVFADDLGIAEFVAAHAALTDTITQLMLSCRDDTGRNQLYAVDLTSSATFQPLPPVPPDQWPPGSQRLPLSGDPMQYSQQELLVLGFGLRPDPVKSPSAYARWLTTTTNPSRRVMTNGHPTNVTLEGSTANLTWGGGLFSAQECCPTRYLCFTCQNMTQVEVQFDVPSVDLLANSKVSFWGGLGGYALNDLNALIQDGVYIAANQSGTAMTDVSILEYFSGHGVGGSGYAFARSYFPVNSGDYFFAEAWACDSSGNENLSGGYGCFYMYDGSTSAYVACVTPSGTCPSLAQINTFNGFTGEGIAEKLGSAPIPQFANFYLYLDVWDSNGNFIYYANDWANTTNIVLSNGVSALVEAILNDGGDQQTMYWIKSQ